MRKRSCRLPATASYAVLNGSRAWSRKVSNSEQLERWATPYVVCDEKDEERNRKQSSDVRGGSPSGRGALGPLKFRRALNRLQEAFAKKVSQRCQ